MEINSEITTQRSSIIYYLVYSGINWLARFVKGGDVKALLTLELPTIKSK